MTDTLVSTDVTAPVDSTHALCAAARAAIRAEINAAKARVARWYPERMPEDWR